jgi:DNA-binding NtrC family response regulator
LLPLYLQRFRSACFSTGKLALADFIGYQLERNSRNALGSEDLGYEKGAFNRAHIQRKDLIVTSDGGTLFLDEIGGGRLRCR